MRPLSEKVMKVAGIQCDAKGCNWENMEVPLDEYYKWVNMECPKCGSNLLTMEDYLKVNKIKDTLDRAGEVPILGHLLHGIVFLENLFPKNRITMKMNGSGRVWRKDTGEEIFENM